MPRPPLLLAVSLAVLLTLGLAGVSPARAAVEPLPSGTDADYQLGGEDAVPAHVGIVARDRSARAVRGRYNICYVNGFQTQPNQKRFWKRHGRWSLVLKNNGRAVVDENWGEWLLDIGTPAKRERLATIVGRWISGCRRDGFQAVELDNLDSYTRSKKQLRRVDAVAFSRLLVRRAHRAGLAVGQKNLADLDGTRVGFDFAVTESCAQFDECGAYVRHFGDQVVMIEYRRRDFVKACREFGATHPVVLRDLDLSPSYTPTYC
ncbi:endo alpha-1,4 polygalactosaminidase [Nocardioides sp. C4-1]|uniref:endo alpha-1,4 polygalactosaminidase n=1 Tax=Nocardioides sp. C4-1 TaxID=3151851 RepID=UPI003263A512